MKLSFGSCTLRPAWVLLIATAPLLVYLASDQLLRGFALNFGPVPEYFAEFDRHRAEAARLGSLGAFFLMASAAAAAFAYFVYTLRLLTFRSLLLVGGAFLGSVLLLGLTLLPQRGPQETGFSGSGLVCTALSYGEQTNLPVVRAEGQPPKVKVADALRNGSCAATNQAELRFLLRWNQIAVLLGLVSLIFGSICCLAGPADDSDEVKSGAHWEEQSERLNGCLYVSAVLLVTGLMFVAAILKWPSFALLSPASYDAHVNALTAYYGFTYTVLLGSFYVPVAVILAGRVQKLKPSPGGAGKVPDAFKGPLQLLKIAGAIFSTSVAGIAANLLALGG